MKPELQKAYDEWQECVKYHRHIWFMPYIPPLAVCDVEYKKYLKSFLILCKIVKRLFYAFVFLN